MGLTVTSVAVEWALQNNWILEWSTWETNQGSMRIAEALGFSLYLVDTEV